MDPANKLLASHSTPPSGKNPVPQVESSHSKKIKFCGYCKNENPQSVCGRCRLVAYCNKDCQRNAWKAHKALCKQAEKTTVSVKATNYQDGSQAQAQYIHRMWEKEQLDDPAARKDVVGPVGGFKKLKEASGDFTTHHHSIKINNDADAVTFCTNFFGQDTIKKLKGEGYDGLKKCDNLQSLIDTQQYIEVLKYVWTELDFTYRIEILTRYAEIGHPLLMLELSRAIALSLASSHSQEKMLDCLKWFFLGLHCVRLDAACIDDPSLEGAADVLKYSYFPQRAIPTAFHEKIKQEKTIGQMQLNVVSKWNPSENHPSPRWVVYHGMAALSGKISVKPQEQWLKARQEAQKTIIKALSNPTSP